MSGDIGGGGIGACQTPGDIGNAGVSQGWAATKAAAAGHGRRADIDSLLGSGFESTPKHGLCVSRCEPVLGKQIRAYNVCKDLTQKARQLCWRRCERARREIQMCSHCWKPNKHAPVDWSPITALICWLQTLPVRKGVRFVSLVGCVGCDMLWEPVAFNI